MAALAQLLMAAAFLSLGDAARGSVALTLGLWSLGQAMEGRRRC